MRVMRSACMEEVRKWLSNGCGSPIFEIKYWHPGDH
jgi:hypothetical protein